MIKLYPTRVRKALLTLTVASFSTISLFAQCPSGSVAAANGATYTSGQVVCVSSNFNSGTITLNSGSQLVITSGNSFKGTINAASGVDIYVQPTATFQPKNVFNYSGLITNYGTTTINFDLNDGTKIINGGLVNVNNNTNLYGYQNYTNDACGTMLFAGSLDFTTSSAAFLNSGAVQVTGSFTLPAGGRLVNRGKMYVTGSYTLAGQITNDGWIVLNGSTGVSGISGTDSLVNKNKFVIGGSANINKPIRNDGGFWIAGSAQFNAPNNFNQVNTNAYLRVGGSLAFSDVISGNGLARVVGSKSGSGAGLFTITTTTTDYDTIGYAAVGADFSKGCGIDQSPTPLPIILQSFTAKASGNAAQINWSTASELNGKAMIVQRSTDGANFEDIATVASTTNSSLVQNYSYIDNNPAAGVNYYRLKLVSSDAPVAYSAVAAVKFNVTAEQQAISVFPNPFTDHFTVKFADVKGGGNVVAKLYNAQGAVILVQSFNSAASVTINTPATLAKGVYVLEISANGEKYYHRLMKL